jgi:redox-sensitive bicupin YhaK (pirin superfamily)
MHKDSRGAASIIKAGGVQWMTAGSGLIHAEISSDDFKKNGGPLDNGFTMAFLSYHQNLHVRF